MAAPSPMTKQCEACGGMVSLAAPNCPHCGHPQGTHAASAPVSPAAKPKRRFGLAHLITFGGLAFFVYSIMSRDGSGSQNSSSSSSAQPVSYSQPAPAAPAPIRLSDADRLQAASSASQKAFLQVIANSRQAYNAAPNDMQRGATRPTRAQALCSAMPNPTFDGWVGKISTLSSNNDGKGVLTIDIGNNVELKTWNNSLSDTGDNTLINPSSALFATVSSMRVGQLVRFSGTLARDRTDCFREASMTVSGAMTEPEFITRFSRVEPL